MTKSIKRNYIYNTSYQILLLITPLITAPYTSRVLGADGIGTYSYISSIVSYFTLFAVFGTGTYGQREVSYVQSDIEKRSKVFWENVILRIGTAALCCVVYAVFLRYQTDNTALYVIMIINIINVAFDVTWFFQGMEEFGKIVGRNFVIRLLNIAFIFIFIRQKDDLALYILGICALSALGSVSLWPYLRTYVTRVKIHELHILRRLPVVLSLFIPTIAIQVYTVLDKTMIGVITQSAYQNGYYEQAEKISKMALTLVTSLGTVMVPRIGYYFAQGRRDELRSYMYRSYHFVWFLGIPLCLGIIGAAGNLVPWFFGPGFDEVVPLLRILCFLILAIGINNVTGVQYLIPTKRQNLFTLSVCIGAALNFGLNLVLIGPFAARGAAIASVAAEITIVVFQLVKVRRELSGRAIVKMSAHYFVAGVVMLGTLLVEDCFFVSGIIQTLVMIASGAAVYAVVLWIMKDEFFLHYLGMALEKVRLKRK